MKLSRQEWLAIYEALRHRSEELKREASRHSLLAPHDRSSTEDLFWDSINTKKDRADQMARIILRIESEVLEDTDND